MTSCTSHWGGRAKCQRVRPPRMCASVGCSLWISIEIINDRNCLRNARVMPVVNIAAGDGRVVRICVRLSRGLIMIAIRLNYLYMHILLTEYRVSRHFNADGTNSANDHVGNNKSYYEISAQHKRRTQTNNNRLLMIQSKHTHARLCPLAGWRKRGWPGVNDPKNTDSMNEPAHKCGGCTRTRVRMFC